MEIIRTENLTKIYHRRHLGRIKETVGIKKIDLEVREGEIFALLGLNGSGKTTTIKLILGLLFPTEGKIYIDSQLMPERKIIRQIGYLPELPYFYKYLSVVELLNFYAHLSGLSFETRKKQINRILEMLRLEEHKTKRLGELSRGMLQRVGLAQALVHQPRILILDEPVAGLDPLGIREMREFLTQLKSEGKTIFFSSHIISEVEKISDRVGILMDGKLIRVLEQSDWIGEPGKLEQIFVETVSVKMPA